jgi:nicotinamidase-related amidase
MKTALLIIDIQQDYFPGGRMELVGINEACSKAKELLFLFREKQWLTFHIQHKAIRRGATFFLPNTDGIEIHDKVRPLPEDVVIVKQYPNAFRETRLLDELKKSGVAEVVVCGAMSHLCIDATTRAAADFGFDCIVVHDACATKNLEFVGKIIPAAEVHGSFMAALGTVYAKTLSLKEFLSSINSDDET